MTQSWDRRQLAAAHGKLRRAARHTELAIERLDHPTSESELRALHALQEARDAATDLRRFRAKERPHMTKPIRANWTAGHALALGGACMSPISPATPLVMLTEKQWQRQVVELARTLGWTVYHTYDSRRSNPGFPDLVLVRDRVLFIELKREQGRLTDAQAGWLDRLIQAGQEVYCWRPRDLEEAGMTLARRETRAA